MCRENLEGYAPDTDKLPLPGGITAGFLSSFFVQSPLTPFFLVICLFFFLLHSQRATVNVWDKRSELMGGCAGLRGGVVRESQLCVLWPFCQAGWMDPKEGQSGGSLRALRNVFISTQGRTKGKGHAAAPPLPSPLPGPLL